MTLLQEFKDFKELLDFVGHDTYGYDQTPPFDDFNKEVFIPNDASIFEMLDDDNHALVKSAYDHGLLNINADDNFWAVATLPYRFNKLTLQEIVSVLWPDVKDPYFHNDSSDREYWHKWLSRPYPTKGSDDEEA